MTSLIPLTRGGLAALALCLLGGLPAAAQDAEQVPGTVAAEDGLVPGDIYLVEQHGDWSRRCIFLPEEPNPCQLYQLLFDQDGNAVAEFAAFFIPPTEEGAIAGANIMTPLQTLLPAGLALSVDGGPAARYQFLYCEVAGCVARAGFTEAEIDQFKRGTAATVIIVSALSPDNPIGLPMSLTGFTAAYNALEAEPFVDGPP